MEGATPSLVFFFFLVISLGCTHWDVSTFWGFIIIVGWGDTIALFLPGEKERMGGVAVVERTCCCIFYYIRVYNIFAHTT